MATPTDRMPCQVCSHGSRLALETALANGKSAREVARTFGIGSGTPGTDTFKADHKKVTRHIQEHMGPAYRDALEARHLESGNNLVDRLAELDAAVNASLARALAGSVVYDADGNPLPDPTQPDGLMRTYQERTILAAAEQGRRNLELRARLSGAADAGDMDALEAARKALGNPETRRMVQALEEAVATDQQRAQE